MPPRERITKAQIVDAAVALIRREGEAALSARSLSGELRCSTQPIFRCFSSMEEVRGAVLDRIHREYLTFMTNYCAASSFPAYKASGMAYIAYAGAQPNCFRMLFMRGRRGDESGPETADWEPTIRAVAAATGLSYAQAERFHLALWATVHGLAVMGATGYLTLPEQTVGEILSDVYLGLREKTEALHRRDTDECH